MGRHATVILGAEEYEALPVYDNGLSGPEGKIGIRNIDERGINYLEQLLEERLGKPISRNFKGLYSDQKIVEDIDGSVFLLSTYRKEDVEVDVSLIDKSGRDNYRFEWNDMVMSGDLKRWGKADDGKWHVVFRFGQIAHPEVISTVMDWVEGWVSDIE